LLLAGETVMLVPVSPPVHLYVPDARGLFTDNETVFPAHIVEGFGGFITGIKGIGLTVMVETKLESLTQVPIVQTALNDLVAVGDTITLEPVSPPVHEYIPPVQPEAVIVATPPTQILGVEADKIGFVGIATVIVTEALSLVQPFEVQANL
jgi:hypothetical protein